MMLTIYTTCRSFECEEFNRIQRNGILSWTKLNPTPQVIILGNEPGVSLFCKQHNLQHIPNVELSETRAPILNKMMLQAESASKNDVMLLASSDLILFQETITAAQILTSTLKSFCAGTLKQDIINAPLINFENPQWEANVKLLPRQSGGWGGDYFLYKKGFWEQAVPPFSIGRTYCDNWLYYYALQKNALVDLNKYVLAIHQKHGYSHVGKKSVAVTGQEAQENYKLAGDAVNIRKNITTIAWANWEMDERGRVVERYLKKCEINDKGNRLYEFGYGRYRS